MSVTDFPLKPTPTTESIQDQTLSALVNLVHATNLVALDKALGFALKQEPYATRVKKLCEVRNRVIRAVKEIYYTLPAKYR